MSNDNGNFGSFFAGVVLGGLIGAGVALSYALTDRGEPHILIKDKSIELKDTTVEKAAELQEKGKAAYEVEVAKYTKKTGKGEEVEVVEEVVVVEEEPGGAEA